MPSWQHNVYRLKPPRHCFPQRTIALAEGIAKAPQLNAVELKVLKPLLLKRLAKYSRHNCFREDSRDGIGCDRG